ncbi:unnamed protein product [Rotaria magnacalcarata]|uniref:Tetratricopeptide repeat protein n=1 Tax=Rotaria magnacalcarata TaxID=392030 RepID=A0A8S2LE84_9BILA|nr:unnamed protein product [Rotaria magnacalcarata]
MTYTSEKALQQYNIGAIILLKCFIQDIYQQLCNEHELLLDQYGSEESFHVYRKQPFHNWNQQKTIVYVNDIHYDSSQYVCILKISVINEIEYSSSGIIEEYKFLLASKSIETKLLQMGNFLYESESSDYNILHKSKAEKCYNALLNVISPSSILFPTCYDGLCWIAYKKNQYQLAFDLQKKVLQHTNISADLKLTIYHYIAAIFKVKCEFESALEYYNRAISITGQPCVRLDKHVTWHRYRNIELLHIACIHRSNRNFILDGVHLKH